MARTPKSPRSGGPPSRHKQRYTREEQYEPAEASDWEDGFEEEVPETPKKGRGPSYRLHKLLAEAGYGSRRDMEKLVVSGRVTVNGQPATQGMQVNIDDRIRIDGKPIRLSFEQVLPEVLIYHKPEGEIVSQDDPEGRPSVFDKLPKLRKGKWISIGRLDINTSGLLIFTTSGALANYFMHPRYEVEREYAVRVFGELTEGQQQQLTEGIELDDGPAAFDRIYSQGGEGANHWYQVMLKEGRNREVRRLFEAFELPVSRLMRVRFGPVNLPPRVKRGKMLKVEQKEVIKLLEWAGLPVPRGPLKQMSPREKLKSTAVFSPKARKQRKSLLDRVPVPEAEAEPYAKRKPKPKSETKPYKRKRPTKRRIRDGSDVKKGGK